MENASKALIIAGAILLSILLISLGIMVYNNAQKTVKSSSLDSQEAEAFNSDWEKFTGNRKADEVMSLYQKVKAHNGTETKKGTKRYIEFKSGAATDAAVKTSAPSVTAPTLDNSKTYKITVGYDPNTGYITNIGYGN